MKTKETLDWILYGKGTYVSALPVLILSAISDVLVKLIERLVKKINNH
jgi:hypothetical protein